MLRQRFALLDPLLPPSCSTPKAIHPQSSCAAHLLVQLQRQQPKATVHLTQTLF